MLREIVSEALTISGGANHAVWLEELYPERDKTRGAFLADELMRLTQEGMLAWSISGKKDLLVCVVEELVLIVRKIEGGPRGCGYILSVFGDGQEILSEESVLQRLYNTKSRRLPIMDLFDVVVDGEKRPVPPAHVCGLPGFNVMLGDSCPACGALEAARKTREG